VKHNGFSFSYPETYSLEQQEKLSEITTKVGDAIKEVGQAGGYVYVMDKGSVVMEGIPRDIFSEVEKLKSLRLDVPQVTLLAHELKKAGLSVPDGVLTREALVEILRGIRGED